MFNPILREILTYINIHGIEIVNGEWEGEGAGGGGGIAWY